MLETSKTMTALTWEEFYAWLIFDKKVSEKTKAMSAIKSRFKLLQRSFVDKEFNRANILLFLAAERQRGIANATLNKYISCSKMLADYFYNFRSLSNKMRIVLAILRLSKSEWIRRKEIEEVAKAEQKLGIKLNPAKTEKSPGSSGD